MSVFLKAIDVIEDRGWCQGIDEDPETGAVCMERAVVIAAGGATGYVVHPFPVVRALNIVTGGRRVAFNDDPSTSYEDVVLALRRAHELSEAPA